MKTETRVALFCFIILGFFFFENKNTGVYLQVICAESKEEKSKAATHAME